MVRGCVRHKKADGSYVRHKQVDWGGGCSPTTRRRPGVFFKVNVVYPGDLSLSPAPARPTPTDAGCLDVDAHV